MRLGLRGRPRSAILVHVHRGVMAVSGGGLCLAACWSLTADLDLSGGTSGASGRDPNARGDSNGGSADGSLTDAEESGASGGGAYAALVLSDAPLAYYRFGE